MRHEAFEHFFDEGLVEAHLKPLKHGKEASVHLFRANPRTTGEELVALKLYHPLDRRDFRDETLYRDGEFTSTTTEMSSRPCGSSCTERSNGCCIATSCTETFPATTS